MFAKWTFRWIGLFWSANFHIVPDPPFHCLYCLPFYAKKKKRRKKCPIGTFLSSLSPLWICISSARVTTGGNNADKPSSFPPIEFTIIYNYYHWKSISSPPHSVCAHCTEHKFFHRVLPPFFSTHSFLLIEKAEIPSWVNIDRFTVILVTPQKAGQNFQFFTSQIILFYLTFLLYQLACCVFGGECVTNVCVKCVSGGGKARWGKRETVLSLRKNKAWWPFRQTCLPTTRLMKSKLMVSK